MKVILFCGKEDSMKDVRHYFNLEHINRRIWNKTGGININNNVVYLIEEKHRFDIDRILMLKTQDLPDNNIFIL